jgi:pyridoxal phosphate enzyme (YggS family)
MEKLKENIAQVRGKIDEAARRAGRRPEEITLVAVTKTVPVDIIRSLASLGVQHIGENRDKWESLHHHMPQMTWHMIGHLQKNKVKIALPIFHFFHSIDSVGLAEELSRQNLGRVAPILLQVNVSGESSKHGFPVKTVEKETVEREIERLISLPNISIQGLMTIAPLTDNMDICRRCFSDLRNLSFRLQKVYAGKVVMKHLSMGMTQDYEIAVEEGATMVRVGSALFQGITGER